MTVKGSFTSANRWYSVEAMALYPHTQTRLAPGFRLRYTDTAVLVGLVLQHRRTAHRRLSNHLRYPRHPPAGAVLVAHHREVYR